MGIFDDLVQVGSATAKKDAGPLDWLADTFGPNGNLRGSAIGGVMQGMADPVVGAVQFVANLPGINSVLTEDSKLSDLVTGKKPSNMVNRAIDQKNAEYEAARLKSGRDGFDAARLTGNVVSPVNLIAAAKVPMAATGMGRVSQGAALGAAAGAMEPVKDTENFWPEKLKQIGAGALGGGIATPIMGKIGDKIARKAGTGVPPIVQQQQVDDAVNAALAGTGQTINDISPAMLQGLRDDVAKALAQGKQLDAAALLRKKDFEAAGIAPLLGQITRDPMQFASELNLRGIAGVGDPIAARLNLQAQLLKDGVGKFGDDAAESFVAGDQLSASLKSIDEAMRKRVSGLYQAARNDAGKDLDVPLQGLAQDYADVLSRFGDKVPSGVRNQLEALGLNNGTQQRVFTIEEADKLLKVINDHVGADRATNTALAELRNSIKNAVTGADPSGGPFKPAVDAAAQRFRLHEAIPALEAAAMNTTAPDDFVKRFVINGKVKDVVGMGKLLATVDKNAYDQARSQIGADLKRAAFGENTAGDKGFAQERFNKRLRELGTDKLLAFFSPDEVEQLKRLGRVGAYITSQPAGAAVNNSNTAATAVSLLSRIPMPQSVRSIAGGVNALATAGKNSANARAAMAADVPVSAADLSPQQANILAMILSGSAVGFGSGASGSVRQ